VGNQGFTHVNGACRDRTGDLRLAKLDDFGLTMLVRGGARQNARQPK